MPKKRKRGPDEWLVLSPKTKPTMIEENWLEWKRERRKAVVPGAKLGPTGEVKN